MSTQETETTQDVVPASDEVVEAEATEVVAVEVTLDEAIDSITDGSRLAAGVTPEEAVQAIRETTAIGANAHKARTEAFKQAAQQIAHYTRRLVILPSQVPDWAGDSLLAQTLLNYSLDRVLNGAIDAQGERRNVRNAILNHVKRTYLELEIRAYVAQSATLAGEPQFPDGPDDDDPSFIAQCRKQYETAGMDVPRQYQTAEQKAAGGRGSGGPGAGPANPMTAVRKGIDGLAAVTTRFSALMLLKGLSVLVQTIAEGHGRFGSSEDKQETGELLMRCSAVAIGGARMIDGVANEADAERLLASYFDDDADAEAPEEQ